MATRLDRLQAGLYSTISLWLPNTSVQWSYQQPTFEQLQSDVVNLQLLAGPTKVRRTRARGTAYFLPTNITLVVPSVTVGQRYWIELNDFLYYHDAIGGDTVDTVRTALVAAINLDPLDPFTAVPTLNAGELALVPDSFGGIYQSKISDNLNVVSVINDTDAALVRQGQREATINIQTFSKSPNPRKGAWAMMETIQDMTESPFATSTLYNTYGTSLVDFGTVTDISAIAGASWESRCSSDVTVLLQSTFVEPTDIIEAVNFTFNSKTPGDLTQWTTNFSVSS